MSNVLEFRSTSAGGSGVGKATPSVASKPASGEVVIFPGVRYERAVEPREPSPKPSRGGRGKARGAR